MITKILTKRVVAISRVLLMFWLLNMLLPVAGYALTSGPSQPEVQSFQAVGTSDMVDLLSGDFKYNIPLMDVDGYPINLNYQSGMGMEDEASWVGLGWNVNVGAINRQVRGIADDLAGEDKVITDHHIKDKVTIGGRVHAKMEFRGKYLKGSNNDLTDKVRGPKISGDLSFGVFNDNYTGYGAEISANAGISIGFANDGMFTGSLGLGVTSSTASGVDLSPKVNLAILENSLDGIVNKSKLSASLGYNTRAGMKSLCFGQTYKMSPGSEASVFFNTEPIMPKIQIPYQSYYASVTFDAGLAAPLLYWGGGATGYINIRKVANEHITTPAFGFLYAERGKNTPDAVMDFIREKENPVLKEMPNLALPVATPDVWTYNSQVGSGQFRLYRGGTGAFFDNRINERSNALSFGADLGFGIGVHLGANAFYQNSNNITQKWTNQNAYLKNGDFQDEAKADPRYHNVFFRNVGELNIEDQDAAALIQYNKPLSVRVGSAGAASEFKVQNDFYNNASVAVTTQIEKKQRQLQKTMISYLTAGEATFGGLDKDIKVYAFNNFGSFTPPVDPDLVTPTHILPRNQGFRKKHHISEITVNESGGQRAVYGFPVYNTSHEEYSFAIGKNAARLQGGYISQNGQVAVSSSGTESGKGIDHYYHKETQPAYAYSYLLSGILSPDYQDITGDGITADDNGSAMRFTYSKIENYQWRTPYNNTFEPNGPVRNLASLNRGLLADPDDDKASVLYGTKEIAYVNSVMSRTKVAYFITEDRADGLGVSGVNGDRGPTHQKVLREIRLYSKMDMSKPIKVVKFAYDYLLCPGTPNSDANNKAKLTLTKVWFEYGNTTKGENHKYKFEYNTGIDQLVKGYIAMNMDRWGTFKESSSNMGGLNNEEFPYSDQNKSRAGKAAALWNLSSIKLPSGGEIKVEYEADDYAYVQDRPAMVMSAFDMNGPANNSLENSTGIVMQLGAGKESGYSGSDLQWFKEKCLNGSDYIYTKTFVKMGPYSDDFDLVPVYCKINNVSLSGSTATITFENVQEAGLSINPIRHAAWQRMKNEYPRYAYPGFQNRVNDNANSAAKAIFSAIGNAASNMAELKENFYKKADRKHLASEIKVGQCFAKIVQHSGFKVGGGVRVKKILINDNWAGFTGTNTPGGTYGQSYDYTTLESGNRISSGVATYEPGIGNDENPFKQPVPYMQRIKGGINNYFELEEPFGESFFPSPSVGYSKVTVRDLNVNGEADEWPKTGLTVNEFYTARDFPTKVTVTPISPYNPTRSMFYAVVATNSMEELTLSQGYCIEVNNMHGKPRAVRTFNSSESEISATEYQYRVRDQNSPRKELDNRVTIVDQTGELKPNRIIGRDIDLFTDFREQQSSNIGVSATIGMDILPVFHIPIPHIPLNTNTEFKLFRSACAVKVVNTSGILYRVIKKQDGSSITVENLAYDGLTGDAVMTKTMNEFKQDFYTLSLPAYWPYRKMGGSYQTLGMVLKDVSLNNYQEINESYWSILAEGDELINTSSGEHYWILDCRPIGIGVNLGIQNGLTQQTNFTKGLIDRAGKKLTSISNGQNTFKVVRSAYRNQLGEVTGSLVTLKYPVRDNRIILASDQELNSYQVLNASATTFDHLWPGDNCGQTNIPIENLNYMFRFKDADNNSLYGTANARIYNPCDAYEEYVPYCGTPFPITNNEFMKRRIWTAGIWIDEVNNATNINRWLGLRSTFRTEVNKTFYIGFSGDNEIRITIDNRVVETTGQTLGFWTIRPINLSAGQHTIEIEGYNASQPDNSDGSNPGSMGVEIYDNSVAELVTAHSPSDLNLVFTSQSLSGINNLQSFRTDAGGNRIWHYTYDTYYNPYVQGMLGNWRPYQDYVYQVNRKYVDLLGQARGVETKNAGSYQQFGSFLNYKNDKWNYGSNGIGWTIASRVTAYDRYGQELENRDAKDKSSAALFDFNGLLPSAVASNAMNREIYFNSFEDSPYKLSHSSACAPSGFSILQGYGNIMQVINDKSSHSGMNSLMLTSGGIKLNTTIHNNQPKTNYYLNYNSGQLTLSTGLGLFTNGFEPVNNKVYVLNFWIRDNSPLTRNAQIYVTSKPQNASAYPVPFECKAIVEGWKLFEVRLPTYSTINEGLELTIGNSGSGNINIDDIRIRPEQSQMRTFVYNPRTFKLMAEMDENAFATFYEYDDEGALIRVKKETERGIATLKETRSALRKQF